jgi:XTP/dITP diphosphohydrolase
VFERLLVATTNAGKLGEIRTILGGVAVEIVDLSGWPEVGAPEETGATFEANARDKARYYAAMTGAVTVAEDSGLEIDRLGGAPGVESARFGGVGTNYPQKFKMIYDALGEAGAGSPARFVCALALADGDRIVFEARETVEGRIAPAPRGVHGFGYDPIFFYPPFGCTLAEVETDRKTAVSHRGKAFRKLRTHLLTSQF